MRMICEFNMVSEKDHLSSPRLQCHDEVLDTVCKNVNSLYGKNLENLNLCEHHVEKLKALQSQLQQTLEFAADETPDKVSKAIKGAKRVLRDGLTLKTEQNLLKSEALKIDEKSTDFLSVLEPNIKKLELYRKAQIYQKWVKSILELGSQLTLSINEGIDDKTLPLYKKLHESAELIVKSDCGNLRSFTCRSLQHWHTVLQTQISEEFNKSLKAINWPFTEEPPSQLNKEALSRLDSAIDFLFVLEQSELLLEAIEPLARINEETSSPSIVKDFDVVTLPLQLLMHPLQVRFFFHFSGNKATNSHENPEWYLTNILRWVKTHDSFLIDFVQPALDRNQKTHVNAKIEFLRGLAKFATLKLDSDIRKTLEDEQLLSSIIQETLNFEREFQALGYPSFEPSVLRVFTQADVFFKWRALEEKISTELLDEFVTTPDAWYSLDNGLSSCGEQLLLLLQGITNRCMQLPQPGHKLQFVELELEILDDFRVRLLQMTRSELADPVESNYCAILNTVHAIIATLTEWSDAPFFVEMQYYRNQFSAHEAAMRESLTTIGVPQYSEDGKSGEEAFAQFISETNEQELNFKVATIDEFNLAQTENPKSSFENITGSPFDDIMTLYSHIETEMLTVLCDHIMREVRARSHRYRKAKWFYDQPESTATTGEVSASLCPILDVLMRCLSLLRDSMNKRLFENVWQSAASSLSKFFYEEIVLENHFSSHGIEQLYLDVYKSLFPIFKEFTKKPESYFILLKESLILLRLPLATAILLKDLLSADDDRAFPTFSGSPIDALEEQGVHDFTMKQALTVLKLRNDLNSM